MNRTTEGIVKDYHNALKAAFETGHLHAEKLHLSPDAVILMPGNRFEGRSAVVDALARNFIPKIKKLDMIHEYYDRSTHCAIYDLVGKKSSHTVPTVEWVKVKDGLIYEIQLFYDTAQWSSAA